MSLLSELLSERDYWIVPVRKLGESELSFVVYVAKGANEEDIEALNAENERLMIEALQRPNAAAWKHELPLLSTRAANVLWAESVTMDALLTKSPMDLLRLPGCGFTTTRNIASALEAKGLKLKDHETLEQACSRYVVGSIR